MNGHICCMNGHICCMYADQSPIVYILYVSEDIRMEFILAFWNFYEVWNVHCKIHLKTVPIDAIGRKFPQWYNYFWDIMKTYIIQTSVITKLDNPYIITVRLTRAGDVTQSDLRCSCGNWGSSTIALKKTHYTLASEHRAQACTHYNDAPSFISTLYTDTYYVYSYATCNECTHAI